jgi:hypothetical protein
MMITKNKFFVQYQSQIFTPLGFTKNKYVTPAKNNSKCGSNQNVSGVTHQKTSFTKKTFRLIATLLGNVRSCKFSYRISRT